MSNKLGKDGHFMSRITLIIVAVVAVLLLACTLLIPMGAQPSTNPQETNPTDSVHLQIPADPTDPTDDIPVVVIPDNEVPVDPTEPTNGDVSVEVLDEDREVIKDIPVVDEEILPEGQVVEIGKGEGEEQDVEQGEIRNDAVLEEKEEAIQQLPKEEHEVILKKEESTIGGDKGEIHESEDSPNPDGEANKNAPEYEESPKVENPFDNEAETEVEDTTVNELIGDGEERPGEGIHF